MLDDVVPSNTKSSVVFFQSKSSLGLCPDELKRNSNQKLIMLNNDIIERHELSNMILGIRC